jgi:DNA-binding MarR family transcriptional regulator
MQDSGDVVDGKESHTTQARPKKVTPNKDTTSQQAKSQQAKSQQAKSQQATSPRATSEQATIALRDVLRGYEAANQMLARRLDLSVTELAAIDHLLEDAALGPVELGNRLGMRSASATALIDRLEAAGHVRRGNHQTDRRRRTLEITGEATDALMQALGPLIGELAAVADQLNARDRSVVHRYLIEISEVLWRHGSESKTANDGNELIPE